MRIEPLIERGEGTHISLLPKQLAAACVLTEQNVDFGNMS